MKATHFIELFTSNNRLIRGHLKEINELDKCLKNTAASPALKTIAVWKIKFKKNGKSVSH
jgi:hypothetical protein